MFPFLIGRIRTKEQLAKLQLQKEFPFLIGRIRTLKYLKKLKKKKRVSIPHR